jgi:transposase
MDNAAFHRKTRLKAMAQEKECRVVFLPAYSPDLNPIEKFWARLKKRLRKILPRYSSLDEALDACFQEC